MNCIPKVPLAPSKCLSKWIKVDKWDYIKKGSQIFFFSFIFQFSFIFFNMKPLSEVVPGLLVNQIQTVKDVMKSEILAELDKKNYKTEIKFWAVLGR